MALERAPIACTFSELFADVQYRSKEIRPHSRDPYGLGPDYLFCAGRHFKNEAGKTEWHVAYVKLVPELKERLNRELYEGPGSVQLYYASRPRPHIYCVAHSRVHIGTLDVADSVADLPDGVSRLLEP